MKRNTQKGFTLIEILVVIGIIAVLAAVVLIAINPARQFAQARDSQRVSNLNSILNAIGQRIADNKGTFAGEFEVGGVEYTCGPLPGPDDDDAEEITSDEAGNTTTETGDLGCLVPTYLPAFPFDPKVGDETNTGYDVYQDSIGRVHVIATEEEPSITREDPIEIVR